MTGPGGVSRRELLAGIGMAGAAIGSSAIGHRTASAFLNDASQFAGNVVTTGEVDLSLLYQAYYKDATDTSDGYTSQIPDSGDSEWALIDGDSIGSLDVEELKPNDSGKVAFRPLVAGNPGFLWLCGGVRKSAENGQPDPEGEEFGDVVWPPDGTGGEIGDAMQATLSYVDPDDSTRRIELLTGSFTEILEVLQNGIALGVEPDFDSPTTGYRVFDRPGAQGCFADAGDVQIELEWWIPDATGNTIMTDELEFEFLFHAQQCRHNAGTLNACATRRGISFVAFCSGSSPPSEVDITIVERDEDGTPVAIEWTALDGEVDTVVLFYSNTFENFAVDGATSGAVSVGAGNVRVRKDAALDIGGEEFGQTQPSPCPDGEEGIKYEWDEDVDPPRFVEVTE